MRDTDLTRLSATLPTPRALLPNDSEVLSVRRNDDEARHSARRKMRGTEFDWEFEYRRQARAGHRYEHPADARPATSPSPSLRPATSPSLFPYTPAPDPSTDPKWNAVWLWAPNISPAPRLRERPASARPLPMSIPLPHRNRRTATLGRPQFPSPDTCGDERGGGEYPFTRSLISNTSGVGGR